MAIQSQFNSHNRILLFKGIYITIIKYLYLWNIFNIHNISISYALYSNFARRIWIWRVLVTSKWSGKINAYSQNSLVWSRTCDAFAQNSVHQKNPHILCPISSPLPIVTLCQQSSSLIATLQYFSPCFSSSLLPHSQMLPCESSYLPPYVPSVGKIPQQKPHTAAFAK